MQICCQWWCKIKNPQTLAECLSAFVLFFISSLKERIIGCFIYVCSSPETILVSSQISRHLFIKFLKACKYTVSGGLS